MPKVINLYIDAVDDGAGDLVLGKRIIEAVRLQHPDAKIQIFTNSYGKETIEKLKLLKDVANSEVYAGHPSITTRGGDLPDLIIVAPLMGGSYFPDVPKEDSTKHASLLATPVVLVNEYGVTRMSEDVKNSYEDYGFKWVSTLDTGLGKDSKGLFSDPELLEFNKAPPSEKIKKQNAAYVQLKEHKILNRLPVSMEDYKKNNFLMFEYTRHHEDRAIPMAIEMAGSKNVDIISPKKNCGNYLKSNLTFLKKKGFSSYEIHNADGSVTTEKIPLSLGYKRNKKTLRVFATGGINHETVKSVLKCSDFCSVTGDMSLGEAISSGVPFKYETLPHKEDHIHNLICSFDDKKLQHTLLTIFSYIKPEQIKNAVSLYKKNPFIFCELTAAALKNNLSTHINQEIRNLFEKKALQLKTDVHFLHTIREETSNVAGKLDRFINKLDVKFSRQLYPEIEKVLVVLKDNKELLDAVLTKKPDDISSEEAAQISVLRTGIDALLKEAKTPIIKELYDLSSKSEEEKLKIRRS